jgi:hypothetical protein
LPLNNFQADELSWIRKLIVSSEGILEFNDLLEKNLVQLRKRQSPKRRTTFKDTYFVDDRARYFSYGLERHAKVETFGPPHSPICEINSIFRFGWRFDRDRHFNVSVDSKGGAISGHFIDCHGTILSVKSRSHINMFPNGFFEG